MTARVVLTFAADSDIGDIFTDLGSKAGGRVAAKYGGLFDALYERLASYPEIGAPRPALGRGVRIGIVSPYVVIYRYTLDDGTVTVLRVVDGRRDVTKAILSKPT